jgi:hypothetical protein
MSSRTDTENSILDDLAGPSRGCCQDPAGSAAAAAACLLFLHVLIDIVKKEKTSTT